MSTEIVLHVGLHRTGTSSFQAALVSQKNAFEQAGITPFIGENGTGHVREVAFATLRPGVMERDLTTSQHAALRQRFADTVSDPEVRRLLVSSEHLSLSRTPEELVRLRQLFPPDGVHFRILIVRREKEEWFRSYADQIEKETLVDSIPPQSRRNISPDSWVRDFEPMIELYRAHFAEVTVLDYDPDDMLAKLMAVLDVQPSFNTRAFRRNARSAQERLGKTGYRVFRSIFGTEHHGLIRQFLRTREAILLRRSG